MHVVEHGGTDREIARGLAKVLADTRALRAKTRRFQRDAGGLVAFLLRPALEGQYGELGSATERLAERARCLAPPAAPRRPLSSRPPAHRGPVWQDCEMVTCLVSCHEAVGRRADRVLKLAERAGDLATRDLLSERIDAHEKTAWSLVRVGLVVMLAGLFERSPGSPARRGHFGRVSGHAKSGRGPFVRAPA